MGKYKEIEILTEKQKKEIDFLEPIIFLKDLSSLNRFKTPSKSIIKLINIESGSCYKEKDLYIYIVEKDDMRFNNIKENQIYVSCPSINKLYNY